MKRCARCLEQKGLTEFPPNRNNKDGCQSSCRSCAKEARRAYVAANPAHTAALTRKSNLKRWYGITPERVDEMRADQGGKCGICREPFLPGKVPHVDHCHKTGAVRALLCGECNLGLGKFKDDDARLMAAADYVRVHRSQQENTGDTRTESHAAPTAH